MISLPGTVGGAVRGNAGCFGGETKDKLVSVQVLERVRQRYEVREDSTSYQSRIGEKRGKEPFARKGKWKRENCSRDDLNMSYRHSILKEEAGKDWIILSATFELESGDPEVLKKELDETMTKRKATQPQNAGCAGCVFKNYEIENDAELARLQVKLDIPEAMIKARRLSAGWIVDQLGLKGFAIGGAKVSAVHGNFLVSEQATSDEIMQLISVVKTRARNELGIQLQEEIQWIG